MTYRRRSGRRLSMRLSGRRHQPKGAPRDMTVLGGWHGWDPASPAMQGIFLAMGPGLGTHTRIDTIQGLEIYPFLTRLLGLKAAPGVVDSPSWVERVLNR